MLQDAKQRTDMEALGYQNPDETEYQQAARRSSRRSRRASIGETKELAPEVTACISNAISKLATENSCNDKSTHSGSSEGRSQRRSSLGRTQPSPKCDGSADSIRQEGRPRRRGSVGPSQSPSNQENRQIKRRSSLRNLALPSEGSENTDDNVVDSNRRDNHPRRRGSISNSQSQGRTAGVMDSSRHENRPRRRGSVGRPESPVNSEGNNESKFQENRQMKRRSSLREPSSSKQNSERVEDDTNTKETRPRRRASIVPSQQPTDSDFSAADHQKLSNRRQNEFTKISFEAGCGLGYIVKDSLFMNREPPKQVEVEPITTQRPRTALRGNRQRRSSFGQDALAQTIAKNNELSKMSHAKERKTIGATCA